MSASFDTLGAAKCIAAQFDCPTSEIQRGVEEFISEMQEGLSRRGMTLSQIPTFVTSVPNGTEQGPYLAVDLGGTNFRVCSIDLHGDSTFSLTQSKVPIPRELMVCDSPDDLFSFVAREIEAFLKVHHHDHWETHVRKRRMVGSREPYKIDEVFDMGFTFSFPVDQVGVNRGKLIRWTKGFSIPNTVGRDVCELLQSAIDELHLPIRVAALVNDAVGTLLARSYTSPDKTETLLGAIFGTGTNGAYVEKLDRLTKLGDMEQGALDTSTGQMVVNTEWGNFDSHLKVLPTTNYDMELDAETVNPGVQSFEKRVSGMFLGDILRRTILALIRDPSVKLFQSSRSSISPNSALYSLWGIGTSFLSLAEGDTSPSLQRISKTLRQEFGVSNATVQDCQAVKVLVHAIGKRAARLSAVPIGAILLTSGRLETGNVIDIGVDGSLIEYYPNFEEYTRQALREIPQIGVRGEKKVRMGIAKDGSGVGAALSALVARRTERIWHQCPTQPPLYQ